MRWLLVVALIILIGASPLAATAPAAQQSAPKTAPNPPNPTVVALSKLNGQAFDVAFMRTLIPIHEEAIEVAMAATLNADHSELLQWNQVMIDRKSGQVGKMLAWLKDAGASPGQRNAGVVTDSVKKMRALQGKALEQTYIPMMSAHLKQSVDLAALAVTKASRPELRAMAHETAKVEGEEVKMLKTWSSKWYGH
jgi:uncharacterized protein (DUF305 family)